MRTLTSLLGNSQWLDGGAMFGNAPRAVWERWLRPDDRHRIPLACRCMLITEPDGRRILCETGIGLFFEPAMRDRYGVTEPTHVLLDSLAAIGLSDADIDAVVLSHLHFDHAGGVLAAWAEGEAPRLLFPNARYIVGRDAWERAKKPHMRDRASFIPGLTDLLEKSGRLELVEGASSAVLPGWRFHISNGHTPGLLLAEVPMDDGPVVFCGDLIPGSAWVHLPITMGYDRYPELLIDEKLRLLEDLVHRNGRLFFTHDPEIAMGKVARDAKGKFSVTATEATVQGLSA